MMRPDWAASLSECRLETRQRGRVFLAVCPAIICRRPCEARRSSDPAAAALLEISGAIDVDAERHSSLLPGSAGGGGSAGFAVADLKAASARSRGSIMRRVRSGGFAMVHRVDRSTRWRRFAPAQCPGKRAEGEKFAKLDAMILIVPA